MLRDKPARLIAIGNHIRSVRERRHMTQLEVALEADMGRAYYGRVERGEANITVLNLVRLAVVLDVEVGDLLPAIHDLRSMI
jgi:transcriptional regulator with XRE-family HTH domain